MSKSIRSAYVSILYHAKNGIVKVKISDSTHTYSGGPAARRGERTRAGTPRTPAGDSVPCTPDLCAALSKICPPSQKY